MPLIIGSGLGQDTSVIVHRVLASEIITEVKLEEYILGEVKQEPTPEGVVNVVDAIGISGTLSIKKPMTAVLTVIQSIQGTFNEQRK